MFRGLQAKPAKCVSHNHVSIKISYQLCWEISADTTNYIKVMTVSFRVSTALIKLPCAHGMGKAQIWGALLSEAAHK